MADKNFLTEIIDADLAEGQIREIHTRFPPEPNGYLHIGSAKAIYINWSIANQYGGNTEAAKAVGKAIAEKALAKGIKEVVFDRGGYLYTGRVAALADAAREAGLQF